MAQSARLSLRMQKEMKLLLTDPPPGAYFPFLSESSSSLSSIDADIEGPEGTVYEKGVFRLKIQIPERYPFQPPIVTFATPIYHPNIDNGGRICLDILNLPPKGAWQPSLNISTVLTSIGLLLSEPNPDDGLMCEASKEYKYNRHSFDQKARSTTEKFARARNGDGSCCKITQGQSSTRTVETKCEIDEDFASNKKFHGNGSKLSLECTKPPQNKDFNNEINEKSVDLIVRPKEVCRQMVEEFHQHHKNLSWTKRKLSLGSLCPSEPKVANEKETLKKKQISSSLNSVNIEPREVSSLYDGRLPNRDGGMAMPPNQQLITKDFADRTGNYFNISKRKKLGLVSKRLSVGMSSLSQAPQTDNKENTDPAQSLPLSYTNSLQLNENHGDLVRSVGKNMDGKADFRFEHEYIGKSKGVNSEKPQEMEGSILPEAVIVLDSEDSEEESKGCVRSRLLLARKRLPGKTKPNVRC